MTKKEKEATRNVVYGTVLILLAFIIGSMMIASLFLPKDYYKIESRVENVTKDPKSSEYETTGWIRVQGTNIDYPVRYLEDVNKLSDLTDDFSWILNKVTKLTDRTVLYGHNLKNISSQPLIADEDQNRFEQLVSFVYYDFAKENKYIQYTIDGKDYLYKIYAISIEDIKEDYLSEDKDETYLKKYIKNALNNSFYNYQVDINESDKLLTLVTCTKVTNDLVTHNLRVDARLVRENEEINDYEVTKNDSYHEIETILGGSDYETNA